MPTGVKYHMYVHVFSGRIVSAERAMQSQMRIWFGIVNILRGEN